MRKTLLVILGVLLVAAVPLFGQWHSDFRVTNNPGRSYTPYNSGGWGIAADDADVHIAWDDHTTSQRIRYFTFPIGSPVQTPNGEAVSTSYGYYPVIAVHDGTVAVSWYYYTFPYYLHTRVKNGSWGSIINHGVAYYCSYPATATDSDGNLHCVFNRWGYSVSVYYQRRNSGSSSFTSPVLVYNPYHDAPYPSICVTSDDAIHVSVGSGPYDRLVHAWSTNNGASWSNEYVTGTSTCSYFTSICCDNDGNLYIAYLGYSYPYQIYVVSGTTGSWGTPVNVSNSFAGCYCPTICCDIYDNVWVAWGDGSFGSAYEIHYNKYDAESGSWEGDSILSSDDGFVSRYCKIAADEKGNVHVCWQDLRDGNFEVYYNWFLGDTTPPPPPGRDLAVVRILQPVDSIGKEPVTPRAVIANLGSDVDSGYARCVITGPGSNYDKGDIEGIVYLEVGEEDAVEFPSWTPPGDSGDRYRVEVTVYLWPEKTTEDDDPTNNTKVEYATINKPNDPDPPPGVIEEVDALRIEVTAFRSGSLVSYVMPYPTETTIRVYDVTGKVVYTLHDGELSGSGSLYWDGTDDAGVELAGGLYFIRIAASDFTKTAKVVLLH